MTQTILIIFGFAIVGIPLAIFLTKRGRETASGICATALDQTVRKNANKEKILALFREQEELSNTDIREATGMHRRSVVRYLNALEREGKVQQVGESGRGVLYRLQ